MPHLTPTVVAIAHASSNDSVGLLVLLGVSVLLAGAIAGLSGFGFNLVSVPMLILVLAPRQGIVVSLATGMTVTAAMLFSPRLRGHIDRSTASTLLRSSLIGVPFGLLLFARASESVLTAIVGTITVAYALAVLTARAPKGSASRLVGALAGATSGALAASTGLSGPPAVLLAHYQGLSAERFRATLTAYFFAISGISVVLIFALRLAPPGVLVIALTLAPVALLGMTAGRVLFRAVDEASFRRLVVMSLLVMGLLNLLNVFRDTT